MPFMHPGDQTNAGNDGSETAPVWSTDAAKHDYSGE
jgi:hypothetical protein